MAQRDALPERGETFLRQGERIGIAIQAEQVRLRRGAQDGGGMAARAERPVDKIPGRARADLESVQHGIEQNGDVRLSRQSSSPSRTKNGTLIDADNADFRNKDQILAPRRTD
jgi:hypothetical protein